MAGLRCASCGAEISPFAERCARCGADPDVTIIELGGIDQPPSFGGPGRGRGGGGRARRGRRWLLPVLVAAVLAWGAGATIVSIDRDGEDVEDDADRKSAGEPSTTSTATTSTTFRRNPMLTTTTVAAILPAAPMLGEPTGLHLLADTPGALMDIDLDTGDIVEHELDGQIAGADEHGVLLAYAGVLSWRPFPLDADVSVPLGAALPMTWLLEEGNAVWVGDQGNGRVPEPVELRLLDLADGSERATVTLPAEAFPFGVSGDQLVVAAAGRVYTLDATGAIVERSVGYAAAAGNGFVVVRRCDGRLQCETVRLDLATDDVTPLPGLFESQYIGVSWIAPNGRVVFSRYGPDGGVFVADADGVRPLADPRQPGHEGVSWASFSADGRWVAIGGNGIVWVGSAAGDGGAYLQIRGGFADGRVLLVEDGA